MTVDELAGYVKQYWPILKAMLLAGEYHPQGVRAVDIPGRMCGQAEAAPVTSTKESYPRRKELLWRILRPCERPPTSICSYKGD